jgi:hypothetical protein
MISSMLEKSLWALGGAVLVLIASLLIGGLYAITPPSGPVDTAYKINRFTGKVWLIKTYAKPVGQVRVVAAREAEVEKTKELSEEELQDLAMAQTSPAPAAPKRRR